MWPHQCNGVPFSLCLSFSICVCACVAGWVGCCGCVCAWIHMESWMHIWCLASIDRVSHTHMASNTRCMCVSYIVCHTHTSSVRCHMSSVRGALYMRTTPTSPYSNLYTPNENHPICGRAARPHSVALTLYKAFGCPHTHTKFSPNSAEFGGSAGTLQGSTCV